MVEPLMTTLNTTEFKWVNFMVCDLEAV
jgi:hypothetical protein